MLAPIPLSVRSPRSLAGPVCALDSLAIAGPSLGLLLTVEIEIHCSDGRIGPRPTALIAQGSVRGGLTVGRIIVDILLSGSPICRCCYFNYIHMCINKCSKYRRKHHKST